MKAFIFDLDGVIVSTDELHYQAWKKMADEEGVYFDRHINERLRGVSRMQSLEIILERSKKIYSDKEKAVLSERKNEIYREMLKRLTPGDRLPLVTETLKGLRENGYKLAIGSSSKNASLILEKIGYKKYFDVVSDGNNISNSKPDPEVFLCASRDLGVPPCKCYVVEDAEAGIQAANTGGFVSVGIGSAAEYSGTDIKIKTFDMLLNLK